jgi:hypothetical protein
VEQGKKHMTYQDGLLLMLLGLVGPRLEESNGLVGLRLDSLENMLQVLEEEPEGVEKTEQT